MKSLLVLIAASLFTMSCASTSQREPQQAGGEVGKEFSATVNPGFYKLSKDCKRGLAKASQYAHDLKNVAMQMGNSTNANQSILNQSREVLNNAVEACVDSAVNSKKRTEAEKIEITKKVRFAAIQYIDDLGIY